MGSSSQSFHYYSFNFGCAPGSCQAACINFAVPHQFCTLSALSSFLVYVVILVIHIQCLAAEHRRTSARKSRRELNCQRSNMQKVVHRAHLAGRSVHNIMLSPYVDYTIGSPQYDWLVNDLRAIDRTQTPFVRPQAPASHIFEVTHRFKVQMSVCLPNSSLRFSSSSICKQPDPVPNKPD